MCQRKTGILYSLNSPVFGDFIGCLNMQERWLRQKRHLTLKQVDAALMKPALHIPTTCLVLNLEGCQRNGTALCVTKTHLHKSPKGSESSGGAVVRALTSHQCNPGSFSRLGVICGLSLLVLFSALRRFSPGTLVFPSTQNLHLIKFDLIYFISSRPNKL